MKPVKMLFSLLFVLTLNAKSQTPFLKSYGDVNNNFMTNFVTDADGNSYVTGTIFYPEIQFGDIVLTNDKTYAVYLVKIDADGIPVWGKSVSADGSFFVSDIALDHNGNILLTGNYGGDTPVFGDYELADGLANIFIVKYANDGSVLWATWQPGETFAVTKMAISDDNEILIGGNITATENFNGSEVESFGAFDAFVARYDAAGNGIWMKSMGGGGSENISALAFDHDDNILIGGDFTEDFTYDILSLDNMDFTDGFIMKLKNDGTADWVATNQSMEDEFGPHGIVVDEDNDVYAALEIYDGGSVAGTIMESYGLTDACIFKLHGDDGVLSWIKHGGSEQYDNVQHLALATDGLFMTGTFNGAAEFGGLQLYADFVNGFISSYDFDGNELGVYAITGENFVTPLALHTDGHGNTYTMGTFYEDVNVDGLPAVETTGSADIFLYKFSSALVAINETGDSFAEVSIYPNPATDIIHISPDDISSIEEISITGITGEVFFYATEITSTMQINIRHLPAGTYFITITNLSGHQQSRAFIKN